MSEAIWKDKIIDIGSLGVIEYRIRVGSNVIYYGKSYMRPDEEVNTIKINDVCADYIESVLPTLSDADLSNLDLTFIVEAKNGSSWVNKASVKFRNDWSYDYDFDPETMGMSFPILNKVDGRMWLTYTTEAEDMVAMVVTDSNGGTIKVYKALEIQADFNNDYNADFAKSVKSNPPKTAVFNLAEFPDAVRVQIGNDVYDVVSCGQYALYYLNAYGGWDSLFVQGVTRETDTVIRHTREMEYDNNVVSNRGKANFVNEIEKNYSLNTGWLTEEGSLRMHHLLNSTNVYLYDIVNDKMIPVVLTNTTTEHKSWKGNGGDILQYTIEATVAQTRVRR